MNRVVSRDEWNTERITLLAREKEIRRELDALSRTRRELPWVRVSKEYLFEGEGGSRSLADLFGGKHQLVLYHFMFGIDWEEGCPTCSLWLDGLQGAIPHLAQRDVNFVTVSSAPWGRLRDFRDRMGWRHTWVSAMGPDFGRDFHVSYSAEEIDAGDTFYNYQAGHSYGEESPGLSVFQLEANGEIFHTYSTYARGLEAINLVYPILDMVPMGRAEEGLPYPPRHGFDIGIATTALSG